MPLRLVRGFGTDHEVFECLKCGAEVDANECIPALHRCKSATDYDEKCDMAASGLAAPPFADAVTSGPATACESRELNSDGLPHQILSLTEPPSSTARPGGSGGSGTTQRHPATPDAADSTTGSATFARDSFDGARERREYSPL